MNRFAYLTTGLAIRTLSAMSKANVRIHGEENIPDGSVIFTVNHFTRVETLLLPCYIYELMGRTPVWSLADYTLFRGGLKTYLDKVGAISTRDPDRDLLIVKTLLAGEAAWIIFPEGRMVKSKKIVEKGRFMVSHDRGKHRPHTGAASLALRTEFYRQRIAALAEKDLAETRRLTELFQIYDTEPVTRKATYIVPVNVTYYPLRAQENLLSKLAVNLMEDITDRAVEEIMTEGSMLLSGVDLDIRFGLPINIRQFMTGRAIRHAITAPQPTGRGRDLPPPRIFRKAARIIMQQYMAAIYQMTTVNHDHLLASLLKKMPYSHIDPEDLRRRIFLAASLDFGHMGVCFHKSLETDQIHLLTDDRYGKVGRFTEVALEKGILEEIPGGFRKNRKGFTTLSDFHRIRVENPVSVMANEVEPLTRLQQAVRRLAWMPPFRVRRRTARYLTDRALFEFDQDYEQFCKAGESGPREIGRPFLIRGETREVGVLLLHGYMAAPPEVAGLADYLGRKGIGVCVPRLKGHGTSPEDLATRTYEDWVASADAGYAIIRSLCKRVVVGGFSTGAALALDLAARVDGPAGVFAVCPPRRLRDPSLRRNLAKDLWTRVAEMVGGGGDAGAEFLENIPENPRISYTRNPVSGIREVERLITALEPKLPQIRIPALVIHSRQDPVADPEASRRIFELLGAEDKTYLLFNFRRHNILSGPGAYRAYRAIWDFIGNLISG